MNAASVVLDQPSPALVPSPCEAAIPSLTAPLKRAAHPLFIPTFSLDHLRSKLPLVFPVDPALPLSPKVRYRSQYCYRGPEGLLLARERAKLTDLQLALHLVDLSPLERPLSQMYVASHKGQVAFHPVSLFVAVCLRLEKRVAWRELARLLAAEEGVGWRELCGFTEGQTPSASGLRYFYHTLGPAVWAELCPQMIVLLQQEGLCPTASTYPDDGEGRGVSISGDGQLHPARSRPSCQLATDSCYAPLPQQAETAPATPQTTEGGNTGPDEAPAESASAVEGPPAAREEEAPPAPPTPSAATADPVPVGRPCRARQHELEGCACDTPACQERCRRASVLDPQARFIHHDGHNDKHGHSERAGRSEQPHQDQGVNLFGYLSTATRLLDDRFATAWVVRSSVYAANTDERSVFVSQLRALAEQAPHLRVGEVLYDAAVGYDECLNAVYDLHAWRMIDIREHPTDRNAERCLARGYDDQGQPCCPQGYPLQRNGYDYKRRQAKYVCFQRCRHQPLHPGEPIRPLKECGWFGRDPKTGKQRTGFVVNVGRTMPDGASRLARDVAYGSETWKRRYGRRNLSENRNSQLEGLGLKRMRAYGLPHCTADIQLADFLIDLRTLGRLVREASNLQSN